MSGFSGNWILGVLIVALVVCLCAQTGAVLAQTAKAEKPAEQKVAPVEAEEVKKAEPAAVPPKPAIPPATEVEIQRRFNALRK